MHFLIKLNKKRRKIMTENKTDEMVYTNKKVFNIQNQKPKTKTPRNYSKNQKSGGTKEKISGPNVKISFLGGVGEIGKNMTVFETEKDIVIIDAGLTFPGDDLPGVDIIVPDISYLLENKHKVRGIIITHGHEDHIGGLPYVLNELKVPVYGSKLTLALIESKLREFKGVEFQGIEVKPKTIVKIGSDFSAEFIRVSHSISGAYAICLNTPAGNIVHTGDFKIDYTPVRGDIIDLTRFGELGKKGVNLLMCESTNVCREGYSMSESNVGRVLEEVAFKKHPEKRLIISTFASNIHRLQQIMTLAEKYKRKIAFTGRSMINVSEVAMKVGELYFKKENIIDIDKVGKYADSELVLVSTGSQGEPMSALTRLADDEFKKVKLTENDCVVLSASPIPGNEKNVYNVINKLIKKGIEVIFDEIADVHTSGHACQEEIKTIHSLVRPRFFIPVHGEYRHLKVHKDVAVAMGMPERNVLIADLGTQFVMTPTVVKKLGEVKAGSRIIDGKVISDYNSVVLKERKQLSEDGFIVAITKISKKTADLEEEPLVITRGFAYDNEGGLLKQLKTNIAVCVKKYDIKETEQSFLNNELRKFISNFVFKRTGRRPIIISTTMIV